MTTVQCFLFLRTDDMQSNNKSEGQGWLSKADIKDALKFPLIHPSGTPSASDGCKKKTRVHRLHGLVILIVALLSPNHPLLREIPSCVALYAI